MPVSSALPSITYEADGFTTQFVFNFRILEEEDIFVLVDDEYQYSGYTIDGVDDYSGGTVEFSSAPADGSIVRIYRQLSVDREQDYTNGARMDADTFDYDFDRTVMLIQDTRVYADNAVNSSLADLIEDIETIGQAAEDAAQDADNAAASAAEAAGYAADAALSETNAVNSATISSNAQIYIESVVDGMYSGNAIMDRFVGDGSTTDFTLSEVSSTERLLVVINGVMQEPESGAYGSYSVSSDTLSFGEAPPDGSVIIARHNSMEVTFDQAVNHVHNQYMPLNESSVPYQDNTFDMGTAVTRWRDIHAVNFYGEASSAAYADLAEMFIAEKRYPAGTVVGIAGKKGQGEVSDQLTDADARVIGVVSTRPGYLMNDRLRGKKNCVPVAYTGRVPVRVTGVVMRGDMLVSAGNGLARSEANPKIGTVIGKSLNDYDGKGPEGTVEVVVGRY